MDEINRFHASLSLHMSVHEYCCLRIAQAKDQEHFPMSGRWRIHLLFVCSLYSLSFLFSILRSLSFFQIRDALCLAFHCLQRPHAVRLFTINGMDAGDSAIVR